jgi:hypothetical protein
MKVVQPLLLLRPVSLTLSPLLSYRGFPVAAVKMFDLDCVQVYPFNTSQVHVDFIRVGARDVKRRHATSRTEVMFGRVGVERIRGEFLPGRQQAEPFTGDNPVNISLLGADRAIALQPTSIEGPDHFINNAPTMASAAVDWVSFESIRHRP